MQVNRIGKKPGQKLCPGFFVTYACFVRSAYPDALAVAAGLRPVIANIPAVPDLAVPAPEAGNILFVLRIERAFADVPHPHPAFAEKFF